MSIAPTGAVKFAQLYSMQKNPSNGQPPILTLICSDDFSKTKALADIAAKYANLQGSSALDNSESYTTSLNASVTGIPIKIVTVGATYAPTATTTIKYTGVQTYSADAVDVPTVLNNLGKACKDLIKAQVASGAEVFLLQGAVKASSINVEVKKNNDPSVTASIKIGSVSPGFTLGGKSNSDVTLSGSNLFFKVTPYDVKM